MEEIIKQITDKIGISPEQAKGAVDMVLNFVKDKLPAGMGGVLDNLTGGNAEGGEGAGDLLDKAKGMLGGLFK
jgi:hypothetical protein